VDGLPRRQRHREPSTTFLEHTLAVAEVSLRLREIANRGEVTLLDVQHEPACWRPYSGPGGGTVRLKPDLAVVTATEKFEDHWFFEVDLATEPPSRVLRACLNYQAYRQSGVEQRRLGLFPAVVWIVPTGRRKEILERRLGQHKALSARLFSVITLDELETLIQRGAPWAGAAQAETENDRAE